MAYTYLMHSPDLYLPGTQALLLETENRLTLVDNLLAQADGINLSVSFGPLNTVRFDSTDIKVLRAMTNLLKAYLQYLQSLDLTITNYSVPYNSQSYDLRYLLTHDAVHVADNDADSDMMFIAWMKVFNNNTNLLTYKDRSATSKLAQFRTTLQTASAFYSAAVTDIQNLTQQQRWSRNDNAFNLDNDYDVELAKIIRDQTITSFEGCMNNSSAQILIPRSVETYEGYVSIDGGDGYYYYRERLFDIYLDNCQPNSSASEITIFRLFALGAGIDYKSPRDIIIEAASLPEGVTYNPYILYESTVAYMKNLALIIWEDFY